MIGDLIKRILELKYLTKIIREQLERHKREIPELREEIENLKRFINEINEKINELSETVREMQETPSYEKY